MSEADIFKSQVEQYLERNDMTPTRFGRLFANDPWFVFQLREGREPRARMRHKILEAMSKTPKERSYQ
jgi:2,4-dienoyl-CoA reductase-like NADH-dependent reductase (Old Yellow Enzyme family)